jgi:8-oxo-dGTP pyrophosphatase MutT (NUDIX family)
MEIYCNNCGKSGHIYNNCKLPIISIGIIAFRRNPATPQIPEYLMICRKHTLGFMDFIRGKYSVYNRDYILNLFQEMTETEIETIGRKDFQQIWTSIWNGSTSAIEQYRIEEMVSAEKFKTLVEGVIIHSEYYSVDTLIQDRMKTTPRWSEPEWGFPKGRRNYNEKDYNCAIREFAEETGYNKFSLTNIDNILPYEEIFIGSNYKSYKHKYFVMYMNYTDSLKMNFQGNDEVSRVEWKLYEDALKTIRPYNLEKIRILENVNHSLTKYKIVC